MRSDSCALYDASILSALWSAAAVPTDFCWECDEATELADVDIERVDWRRNDNTHARASVNKTTAHSLPPPPPPLAELPAAAAPATARRRLKVLSRRISAASVPHARVGRWIGANGDRGMDDSVIPQNHWYLHPNQLSIVECASLGDTASASIPPSPPLPCPLSVLSCRAQSNYDVRR